MSTDDRDWFSPASNRPPAGGRAAQRPAPRPRHMIHPDHQVWPLSAGEPVDSSTQPIPTVRTPTGPPPPARPPAPQVLPPAPVVAAAEAEQPPRRRRGRVLLQVVGAVVATVVAVGAYTYDGYLFYDSRTSTEARVITVPPGGTGTVYDIAWTASVAKTQAPADSKLGASVTWLKVDITRELLKEANATMVGSPRNLRLEDRAGRTWVVEVLKDERPTDRLEVGKEYVLEAVAVVPSPVAGEVELSFRPTSYRSDTPTEDLMKRGTAKPDLDVLRFTR